MQGSGSVAAAALTIPTPNIDMAPMRQHDIPGALENLTGTTSELEKVTEELRASLSPIVRPVAPDAPVPKEFATPGGPTEARAPLAESIRGIDRRMVSVINQINDLIGMLEL